MRAYWITDDGYAEVVDTELGVEHVFEGLEEMDWTGETSYNDAFQAARNTFLRENGITVIS